MMKRRNLIYLLFLMVWFLNGCNTKVQQVVTMEQEPYEKLAYQTAEVQRGNLSTSITLTLNPEGYKEISYYAPNTELKLDTVYVSLGDWVEKGEVLVSFESESIRQNIADYTSQKEQNELLIEHYENLMSIDASADYQADIKMLREDIHVAQLYIEEAESRLAEYQIIAREAGRIKEVSEYLQSGSITPGAVLLSEVCGTGRYQAATTETEIFAVGEVYTAAAQGMKCELNLVDMAEGVLTFEPVSDLSLMQGGEILTLTVEKPQLTDVVYVDKNAVCTLEGDEEGEDTYCVYMLNENGYQRAVPVTIGERVGGNQVIAQGLKGGEKVVIR